MKHSMNRFALLALAGAAVAGTAFSQSAPPTDDPPPAKTFQELDANSDGFISAEEAAVDPALTQDFARRDADADGKLSEDEFLGSEAPPTEPTEPTETAAQKSDT